MRDLLHKGDNLVMQVIGQTQLSEHHDQRPTRQVRHPDKSELLDESTDVAHGEAERTEHTHDEYYEDDDSQDLEDVAHD